MSKAAHLVDRIQGLLVWLVFVLLPLYVNPWTGVSNNVSRITVFRAIVLLIVLLELIRRRWCGGNWKAAPISPWFRTFLSLYAAVYLFAGFQSIDWRQSFRAAIFSTDSITTLCVLAFSFWFVRRYQSGDGFETLSAQLLIASVPISLIGLAQLVSPDLLRTSYPALQPAVIYPAATFDASTWLGAYLAMVIPFTYARLLRSMRSRPGFAIRMGFVLLLQVLCLISARSRGAWLGWAAATVLFWGLVSRKERSLRYLVIYFLAAGAGISLFFFASQRKTPIDFLMDGQRAPVVRMIGRNRTTLWLYALEKIRDRPIQGYGPETFTQLVDGRRSDLFGFPDTSMGEMPESIMTPGYPTDPHNLILSMLLEAGSISLFVFSGAVFLAVREGYRELSVDPGINRRLSTIAMLSSSTAYLVFSQFNPNPLGVNVIFWVGICWLAIQKERGPTEATG